MQLVSTRGEVILLASMVYDLGEVHNKAKLEDKEPSKRVRAEAKKMEEHIGAERNGDFSLNYGVSRSVRVIFKATDERNTGHADKLTQL